MERIGVNLVDLLGSKDPWGKMPCERDDCWNCCDEASMGQCRYEGVTYSITCLGCLEKGVVAEYTGESSRSLYQRGAEHIRDLKAKAEESPLWKHCAALHNGEEQLFKMRLLAKHQTAFERQLAESVNITYGKRDIVLNSKAE